MCLHKNYSIRYHSVHNSLLVSHAFHLGKVDAQKALIKQLQQELKQLKDEEKQKKVSVDALSKAVDDLRKAVQTQQVPFIKTPPDKINVYLLKLQLLI